MIASDHYEHYNGNTHYLQLDVLDHNRLQSIIHENSVTQVYLLAAMLLVSGGLKTNRRLLDGELPLIFPIA